MFKWFRFLTKFAVFITVWTALLGSPSANAAELNFFRVQMKRLQANAAADIEITFRLPAALTAGGQLNLDFTTTTAGQTNFTFAAGGSTTRDIDITTSSPSTIPIASGVDTCTVDYPGYYGEDDFNTYGSGEPILTTSTSANASNWGFTSSALSNGFRIILDQPNSAQLIPANTCVRIRIGSNASNTTATTLLTNPGSTTNTSTQLRLAISDTSDSGGVSLAIISDDQPVANATNTPSMTAEFTIDAGNPDISNPTCTSTSTINGVLSTLHFGDLRADGISNTTNLLCSRITSNAVLGIGLYIRSALGQMSSTRTNPLTGQALTFPANAQTTPGSTTLDQDITYGRLGLNTSTEGYGYCLAYPFSGDSNPFGGGVSYSEGVADGCGIADGFTPGAEAGTWFLAKLTNSLQPVWTTDAPVYRYTHSFQLVAAPTVTTPADNGYQDTITVVALATY